MKSFCVYVWEWEQWINSRWADNGGEHCQLAVCGLGVGGEAGEVHNATVELILASARAQERIKKQIRGDKVTVEKRKELLLELGDVLHYTTRIAQLVGSDLAELMELNAEKLDARGRDFGMSSKNEVFQ